MFLQTMSGLPSALKSSELTGTVPTLNATAPDSLGSRVVLPEKLAVKLCAPAARDFIDMQVGIAGRFRRDMQ